MVDRASPRQRRGKSRGVKWTDEEIREEELNDLRSVMSTPEGRRHIWKLMGACGVFESVLSDERMIFYNSGKQDVGHEIMADVTEASPELYIEMTNEAREREEIKGE